MRERGRAVAVVLVLFLAGCEHATGGDAKGGGGPPQMPPALVTVAPVESATLPVYIDAIGRCTAYENVSVQPQVTGAIASIDFKDGAELSPGDLLFTIDARPYKAQLDLAEANLAQAQAQLELNQTELERMVTLLKTNAVSRQEHDARKNAVSVSEAQVRSALASVAAAKINLDFCTIRAPISGRAGQRFVDLGAVVVGNAGTTLLTIQRQDPIYVDFTVSERDLPAVRRALVAKTVRAEVQESGEGGVVREGAVTFLDNAVQDATGTIKLRAQLENKDHVFWPGQFVSVRVVLRQREGALVIPQNAVQIGQQGPFVYVFKENRGPTGTADLRPVTPGQRHGERVIIEKGLEAGERVIVRGMVMLMPGGAVQIAPPAAPQGAAGAPR